MPDSLTDLVRQSEHDAQEATNTTTPTQDAEAVEKVEQSPVTEDKSGTDAAATASTFRNFLAASKFDVPEDIDEPTLQQQIAQRLHFAAEAEQENRRLKEQLQSLQTSQSHTQTAVPDAVAAPVTPAEPAVPENKSIWSESYQLNPADISLVVRNAKGLFEPRDDSQQAREAADAMNRSLSITQQRLHQFASNPSDYANYIKQQILDEVKKSLPEKQEFDREALTKEIAEKIRAEQQAAATEAKVDNWYESNKAQLFKLDANGDFLLDPMSGAPIKTEAGKRFELARQTLSELGVTDEMKIISTWESLNPTPAPLAPTAPVAQAAPVANPVETRETQQRRFLDREEPLPEVPSLNRTPGRPAPTHAGISLKDLVKEQEGVLG